jgi:c(7)-type cytochrome triheme protein
MRRHLILVAALMMLFTPGCVKTPPEDISDREAALNTIPFYNEKSYSFNTKSALKKLEADKLKDEEFKAKVDTRIREGIEKSKGSSVDLQDPWVPPVSPKLSEMPLPLRSFPKDFFGFPDWSQALRSKLILPRGTILQDDVESPGQLFDKNIVFLINDQLMADVLFPHREHIDMLSCDNCHPAIFKPQKGANRSSMYDIWNGQSCGVCHGKVAFQAKGFENCKKCHSQSKRR